MRVTAELFGDLRWHLPKGEEQLWVDLPAGGVVRDLERAIGFEEGEVWRVSVGDRLVEDDEPLREGDRVLFFPPIGGGSEG